jgi:hypothetical protein
VRAYYGLLVCGLLLTFIVGGFVGRGLEREFDAYLEDVPVCREKPRCNAENEGLTMNIELCDGTAWRTVPLGTIVKAVKGDAE